MAQRRPLPFSQLQLMRELARKVIDNPPPTPTGGVGPSEAAAQIVKITLAAALLEAIIEIERLSDARPAAEIPFGFICASCGASPPRCCLDSCVRVKRALFYGKPG